MSTARERKREDLRRFRARKREGRVLLPRFEISYELADVLVDAGVLCEWDAEDPKAIADAIVTLLERLNVDLAVE